MTDQVDFIPTPDPDAPEAEAPVARDESGRFVSQNPAPEPEQTDDEQPPQPRAPRKLKVANDEFDLPDELPDEVYEKVSKTTADLHGAWTRRMQEVAEARKEAEAALQQRMTEWQATQANLELVAEHKAAQKAVKEYEGVNWQALQQQDPNLAQQHWMYYQMLQNQLNAKEREIGEKKQAHIAAQHEAFRRAAYEMDRALRDPVAGIPNWSDQTFGSLTEYATTLGFKAEEIRSTMDPRAIRVLHKAYLYDQSVQKAKAATASQQKPAPVSKVGGTAAAGRVDPDKMSTEDWLKWREKSLRATGGR